MSSGKGLIGILSGILTFSERVIENNRVVPTAINHSTVTAENGLNTWCMCFSEGNFVIMWFVISCFTFTLKALSLSTARSRSDFTYLHSDLWFTLSALLKNYRQKQPIPKQQILDASKLKEFPDNSFKSDENYRKFSKWVENTVGKAEIAHYEQFLLLPQCFQKTFTADMYKPGLVWERVKVPIAPN